MKARRIAAGFTLIELMVVVIIIAALAGMVLPRVLPASDDAKRNIAQGDIANITVALKLFYLHNDRFPTTEEGLGALIQAPASAKNWHGPYLDRSDMPEDPWKQVYQYRCPGTSGSEFDLWSIGKDGQGGTGDDVTSWGKKR